MSPVPSECGLAPKGLGRPSPTVGFPRLQAWQGVKPEYTETVDGFSIHDSFVVASHVTRDTTAVVTDDGEPCENDASVVRE